MTLPQYLYSQLSPHASASRWLVAYSGGVDSHVLLHCLALLKRENPAWPDLAAVHIDHQLQSQSTSWVDHCRSVCDALSVLFFTRAVVVEKDGDGLESAARRARYAAFAALMEPDDVLLQGHHRDDQVETVFLRLLRGAGVGGLSGIPPRRALSKGQIFRPLLALTRAQILDYARQNQLRWIEDPSNKNTNLDRNFLRQHVLPLINNRWPAYRDTVTRNADWCSESEQLQADLAAIDLAAFTINASNSEDFPASKRLPLAALKDLSRVRQKNLLRYWLGEHDAPALSAAQWQQIFDRLINAGEDAQPAVQWSGRVLRRFDQALWLGVPMPLIDCARQMHWSEITEPLCLGDGSTLRVTAKKHVGLAQSLIDVSTTLTVGYRKGGERCRPQGRAHSQTLKKLLQEYRVPPWLRDRVPLIYRDDELIAVAGYWVCADYLAGSGETGWQFNWQTPPDW